MDYQNIIYEKAGAIATITLNKPEKLNTFVFIDGDDVNEIWSAVDDAGRDPAIKVIVLKGKGRAFCTGQDLTQVGFVYGWQVAQSGERVRAPSQRVRLDKDRRGLYNGFTSLLYCPKITIAQLHGYALGGGLILSCCCDISIASEDCKLGHPQERMAFVGAGGFNLIFMTHMVGWKRAREMALTGRVLNGKEAERLGLITKAVPADKLEETVNKVADTLTLLPADAIAIGKAAAHVALDQMGFASGYIQAYAFHAFGTNMQIQEGEFNFFKERRDAGAKGAFHERDARFKELEQLLAPSE